MKKIITSFIFLIAVTIPLSGIAREEESILIHLKTGLKHDDADAVNTFKVGWLGKDAIEAFPLPERLRKSLAEQYHVDLKEVPEKYGTFQNMLHEKEAEFNINSDFLVLAKVEKEMGTVENISAKFFRSVSLKEMLKLRTEVDHYMVY